MRVRSIRIVACLGALACTQCRTRAADNDTATVEGDSKPPKALEHPSSRPDSASNAGVRSEKSHINVTSFKDRHESVKQFFRAEWNKLLERTEGPSGTAPADPLWQTRISPPFPDSWPPDGDNAVVYYAYAAGRSLGLHDAERLGPVWAKLTVKLDAKTPPRLEVLERDLVIRGTHGVRPLTASEAKVFQTRDQVEALVEDSARQRGADALDNPRVRAYYCLWARTSGIGALIRPKHPEFFRWLNCPSG